MKKIDEHREQREPVPAEDAVLGVLRLDDLRQVQRAGAQQHGDDHEADRDLVGHHLRGRAQRAQERVFRVRRPAAHDDAVDAERRDREDVEDADIEVGDGPAGIDRDDRPGRERQHREGPAARGGRRPCWREAGMTGSFTNELRQVGEALQQAPGPDDVRTAAQLHGRPDLAVRVEREGDGDEQARRAATTLCQRRRCRPVDREDVGYGGMALYSAAWRAGVARRAEHSAITREARAIGLVR